MWQNTAEKYVFQNTLGQFGFGKATGIDLPYEFTGRVPTAELKKQLAEEKVISPEDGAGYFVGDNLQLAIGGGLFAASPLQLVNGYSTFANGGDHLQPRVAAAVLAPGTPDQRRPASSTSPRPSRPSSSAPVVVNHVDIPQDWQANITARPGRRHQEEHLPDRHRLQDVPRLRLRLVPDRRQDRHRPGGHERARRRTRRCSSGSGPSARARSRTTRSAP